MFTATQFSPKQTANVAIVGGGVIGLTIARALALRGVRDISIVERSSLGTEASFAAAGMLAPQAEADSSDEFFRFTCQSREMYANFAASLFEETGVDVELDTTGTLYLALTEHDRCEIHKRYDWQTGAGLPVARLTAADVRALEPGVNPAVQGALHFPLDVQVENRRLLTALANSVNKLGVRTITEASVESLRVEKDRVIGVQTTRGFLSCSTVVIAAGSWTSSISVLKGETEQKQRSTPPIEPVRGQMLCFDSRPQLMRHVIYSPRGYTVPRRDGRLLAGSTSEEAGFAKQVTAGGVSSILSHAMEIAPTISSLPLVDSWAGLRPRAPDGLPVLGPCDEIDGLFYATGHYRNGILLAPITGELIAQALHDGVVSPALVPFRPGRFRAVSLIAH